MPTRKHFKAMSQRLLFALCLSTNLAAQAQASSNTARQNTTMNTTINATMNATTNATTNTPSCPALLNHTLKKLQDDTPMPLCALAGKVVLIVNTASYCGFTNQYKPLEALHAKYKSQGLVVLGIPSNDFGKQEPGTSKEIADFCVNTYGVAFPMASKTIVVGKQAHPLYQQLAASTGGKAPSWNFHKYLIARDGKTVTSFESGVAPDSAAMVARIETFLAQK